MKHALLLFVPLAMLAFAHPTGVRYFASFTGRNHGLLKAGSNSPGGRETQGWFEIANFNYYVTPGTSTWTGGTHQGKDPVQNIVINKKNDVLSAMLAGIAGSNEAVDSIIINSQDGQRIVKTTVIKNARIKEIKKNGALESITLSYEKMEER